MTSHTVMIVRVYITEASNLLKPIMQYLQNEIKVKGVSVFRAISGYGESGLHNSSLVDLSLDLPLIIEFFESTEKAQEAINYLNTKVHAEHIIFWKASTN